MSTKRRPEWCIELILSVASGAIFVAGWISNNHLACASALTCAILVIHRWYVRQAAFLRLAELFRGKASRRGGMTVRSRLRTDDSRDVSPSNSAAFVREMIFQGRYAVLLRPEVAKNLSEEQREEVRRALAEEMSDVKAGRILLQSRLRRDSESNGEADRGICEVESFYMDRYAVSNLEFREFVNAGGYEQPELWDEAVRDSLRSFTDETGRPGPRFWREGTFPSGSAHLPVVGLSWYEADAYARWVGKRLPSNAEWLKAALSPASSLTVPELRTRFPWGNAFRDEHTNLWSSARCQPVPVEEYPGGQTAGGIRQLVGNVWEWMSNDLADSIEIGELVGNSTDMKTIRGGAFDTYLEAQAACTGLSGDHPLARRDNIGFRCILPASDVLLDPSAQRRNHRASPVAN